MKLHGKILTALLPLIALPIAVLGAVAYQQQRQGLEQEARERLANAMRQVAAYYDARLKAVQADAALFARSRTVQRYLLTEDEELRFTLYQPGLLKLFATYQEANPEYFEIRVLLPDGYEDTRAVNRPLRNTTEDEGAPAPTI